MNFCSSVSWLKSETMDDGVTIITLEPALAKELGEDPAHIVMVVIIDR